MLSKEFKEANKENLKSLDAYIKTQKGVPGNLMSVLHKAQDLFGYLPEEVQTHIGESLNIPLAKIYGVVSFYSYFTTEPKGKYVINVCMGTACFVQGSERILDKFKEKLQISTGETTEDGMFTLTDVRCIGACGLAPVVLVNEKVYGKVKLDEIDNIIKAAKEEEV